MGITVLTLWNVTPLFYFRLSQIKVRLTLEIIPDLQTQEWGVGRCVLNIQLRDWELYYHNPPPRKPSADPNLLQYFHL